MKTITPTIVALIIALALPACSSTGAPKPRTETDAAAATGRTGTGAEGGPEIGRYGPGRGRGTGMVGDPNDPAGPLARRIIYFEYDSDQVLPEYVPVVNAHARYLASRSGRSVTLEGHADERGSSEYNVGLGEQRARAVAQLMTLQGVTEEQIQIVSFGEEKPASLGHDDASWQQNRRVEISYSGR